MLVNTFLEVSKPPLFPELIPVSEAEITAWLDRIPNLSGSEFRREAYRKAYRVDEKIRAKKRAELVKKKRTPRRNLAY